MYRLIRNLYLLAFITTIIFVTGWSFQHQNTRREMTVNAQVMADFSAQIMATEISGWLNAQSRTIESAAHSIALENWSDEEILNYLSALLAANEGFSSIYFGASDNQMINASGWEPPADFDLRKRPWYAQAANQGSIIYTEAFLNASNDMTIITIACPIYNRQGSLTGVVGGDVSIDRIVRLVSGHSTDNGGFSFLIDGQNNVLAHPEIDYNPSAGLVSSGEIFKPHELPESLDGESLSEITISDKKGYLALRPLEQTSWHLASFIPYDDFMRSTAKMTNQFIFAVSATILVFALFIIYNNRFVHKPLLQFEKNIKQIDLENTLSYRLPEAKDSQFSELGMSINRLLDKVQSYYERLEEKEQSLKRATRELEAMVKQLTTTEEALDYSEEKLYYLSYHDQLTGLKNRYHFEAKLTQLSSNPVYPTTIILIDIDGLKLINDTLGHSAGDRLLKNCATIITEALEDTSIVARIGGDEFSILLPLVGSAESEILARRIRHQASLYSQENTRLPLSISMGLATTENAQTTILALVKKAEDLMFRDKLSRSSSARNGVVQSLLAALCEKDYIAEGHADRLLALCHDLGEKVDLPSHRLSDLALLAQVHDLGKVGIPDQILFKPGRLDKEEWEIMVQHPEKGFRIASSSSDLAGVADLILKHHERWDGTGYPLGLAGADIPIECRILAIADAFDAMTHNRPYHQAVSPAEAAEEIKRCAGSQFDPDLVKHFLIIISKRHNLPT